MGSVTAIGTVYLNNVRLLTDHDDQDETNKRQKQKEGEQLQLDTGSSGAVPSERRRDAQGS